jgi:hypothetical protein
MEDERSQSKLESEFFGCRICGEGLAPLAIQALECRLLLYTCDRFNKKNEVSAYWSDIIRDSILQYQIS